MYKVEWIFLPTENQSIFSKTLLFILVKGLEKPAYLHVIQFNKYLMQIFTIHLIRFD